MRRGWTQQTVTSTEYGVRCTGLTGRASLLHMMNDTSATAPLLVSFKFPLRNKHFVSLIAYFSAVL